MHFVRDDERNEADSRRSKGKERYPIVPHQGGTGFVGWQEWHLKNQIWCQLGKPAEAAVGGGTVGQEAVELICQNA